MIAIKDMGMPNACTFTQEIFGDTVVVDCPLYNVCKHRDTIRTNYKPSDCPLEEIITCKDCKHWKDSDGVYRRGVDAESKCPINNSRVFDGTFYCADFEKRGSEK